VEPAAVPNPRWLTSGIPSVGQQRSGDELLARHKFVVLPSAVSTNSWNVVATVAAGAYTVRSRERFSLDTRLHRPRLP
jgi:RES domain-containing protein